MNEPFNQIDRAREWALFYRSRGYQPLPSAADEKRPTLSTYAEYWEIPIPETIIQAWRAPNIQLMTGAHWKLCVVDCDGPRAHDVWQRLCADHQHDPHTWIVQTGSGGMHYYYALPENVEACHSRRLWGLWDTYLGPRHEGDWTPRNEIRLLGDRALVVAPPSRHIETKQEYFFTPQHLPGDIGSPLAAPQWLLDLPRLDRHRLTPPTPPRPRSFDPGTGPIPDRDAVLAAIGPNKHLVAAEYGLRLAGRGPNPDGWVACRAIDREDRHPSASIHQESGVYYDFASGQMLSFFDLVATLAPGIADWRDAIRQLGQVQGVHPTPRQFSRPI